MDLAAIAEQKVQLIESEFLQHEQVECPVVHRFGPNIYIREVHIPAGTLSVGHAQKTTHLNVMLKGRVIMVNVDGSKTEVTAPVTFVAPPGRKLGYILEDMIWQNIYATDETDIETLEAMFLDKSTTWQEHQKNSQLLLSFDRTKDVVDYYSAIAECGFTHELVKEQSENTDDQTKLPHGAYKMMVAPSNIEGKGVFATGDIKENEVIAPARIDGKRTPAGRYTNHAKHPNAIMVLLDNGDVNLVAKTPINGCKGGNLGDEITIDYRQAVSLATRRI